MITKVNDKIIVVPRPSIIFMNQYFPRSSSIVGVEVGVFKGQNALEIFIVLSPKKMILVDTWNFSGDKDTEPCNLNDLEKAKLALKNYETEFYVGSSNECASKFLDDLFDFVYIDASHSYNNVIQDISLWYPKIKKSGVLAGHDIRTPGVLRAVGEKFGDAFYIEGDDWWVIKSI